MRVRSAGTLLLAMTVTSTTAAALIPRHDHAASRPATSWQYSVLDGCFHQSRGTVGNGSSHDYLGESFGLIDTSKERWDNLRRSVARLNGDSDDDTRFKVLFLGRHGQGWHNVAEQHYGSPEWNRYWSKVNTDGNMTWGPDAHLTPVGVQQAQRVHRAWKKEALANAPIPPVLYSSPLSRAASTCEITYAGFTAQRPVFTEDLRETIGVHTCDKRHSKTWLSKHYPQFAFAEPFTEKDALWQADLRETEAEQDVRSRNALDHIFSQYPSTYVSITAHGGTIASILRVVRHTRVETPTGSITPVVVKAVRTAGLHSKPSDTVYFPQRVFAGQGP